jgi:hypothetical protein
MLERRRRELDQVRAIFGEIEVGADLDWLIVKHWPLSPGWTRSDTQVLVMIPPGYPTTSPDNFSADGNLRLGSGSMPGNASPGAVVAGRTWLQFSYHVEAGDWQPHADVEKGHNLVTFLNGVGRRLADPS